MRALMVAGTCLIVAACAPGKNISPSPAAGQAPQTIAPDLQEPEPVSPRDGNPPQAQPVLPLACHTLATQAVTISMVCFDDRQYRLIVADQPDGCGSKWMDARSAAASHSGLAAINGGFFTPEGKPLGLLVTGGTRRGHLNPSSLGTGIYASSASRSAIIRREQYASSRLATTAEELLQAGPMLVEQGMAVAGLSGDKHRPRSFIAWDGRHHWAIGYASPCTLAGLASALVENPVNGFKPGTALNLDGGRSSDLWVGPDVPDGGKTHRSILNKAVRNYLVLTAR